MDENGLFKKVLDITSEGFWLIDGEKKTIHVNESLCHMLGYGYHEFIGKSPLEFVDEENKKIFIEQMGQINSSKQRSYRIELRANNGENIPTRFNATTIHDDEGKALQSFAMVSDMRQEAALYKALESANEKLRISENLVKTMLDTQENLIVVTDGKKIIHANNPFLNFFGIGSLEELAHTECLCIWFKINPLFYTKNQCCHNWLREVEHSGWRVDSRGLDGKTHNFIVIAHPWSHQEGLYVVTFNDVTALQEEKEFFVHLATTDTLTTLHNRAKLNEMLEFMVKKFTRYHDAPFCVVMYDIDNFKHINDTYGHQVGDFILKELSLLVSRNLRSSDFVARYGGEEFIIILPHTVVKDAVEITQKLRLLIEKEQFSDLHITCSFGVYQFTMGDSVSSMIDKVDKLLYKAKENGRNRIEY